MSKITAEGLNHYTMVYGLNSRKLRKSVVGHHSVLWRSIEDCFREFHAFDVGYERAKGYGRAELDTKKASTINEVKSKKDAGPCLKCSGPHFQNTCTKYTNQVNNQSLKMS